MRKKKVAFLISLISLLLLITSMTILAEERSIYVGDLIKIEIETNSYSEDDIRAKFKDFEIVDINNTDKGYLLTFRSFETGKKTIQLDNNVIELDIKSTLDEIDRDSIYEGDGGTKSYGFSFNYSYIFYLLTAIFLIMGCISLWQYIKRRKTSLVSAFVAFKKATDEISLEERDCFVIMTLNLKNYLQTKYSCSIRGKTCNEIIIEISSINVLESFIPNIKSWLQMCDYYKFTGVVVTTEQKQELLIRLVELVEKIEQVKEVEV
ncbi:hypothetical protein [Vallitalea sp.]|jgi:hypothetical protein|uniref:hypothetical protein n=1 Tax=Vallitalea sp. TaxID=1882829 RepID=UPI0025FDC790|nr:hypothetical protein [Vallitalea sp.]MCT4688180.1 hypothetical protein [Vallitalea sp.]